MDENAQTAREGLFAAINAFTGRPFAVVDGAQFEDITRLFKQERLFARSLFLDTAEDDVLKAGPWLVKLDQAPAATEQIMTLVGDRPAAVYWSCESGETLLWRHLRSINTVRIPQWAAYGGTAPPPYFDGPAASETVAFRHWDPRVLDGLLPVLDQPQFARFVGPAEEIAFFSIDRGGCRRVVRDQTWPPMPAGPLRVTSEQMTALTGRRLRSSGRRIVAYLRHVAPRETSGVDEAALLERVEMSQRSGLDLGLSSERDLGRWSYVMAKTNWRALEHDRIRAHMLEGADAPSEKVVSLVDMIAAAETRTSHA